MGFADRCRQLCKMEAKRLVMVMGLIATTILVFQSHVLPAGNVLSSLLPCFRFRVPVKRNFDNGKDPEENFALDRDRVPNQILPEKAVDPGNDSAPEKVGSSVDNLTILERAKELAREVSPENNGKPGGNFSSNNVRNSGGVLGLDKVRGPDSGFAFDPAPSSVRISDLKGEVVGNLNMSSIVHEVSVVLNTSSTGKQGEKHLQRVKIQAQCKVFINSSYNADITEAGRTTDSDTWDEPLLATEPHCFQSNETTMVFC